METLHGFVYIKEAQVIGNAQFGEVKQLINFTRSWVRNNWLSKSDEEARHLMTERRSEEGSSCLHIAETPWM